MKQDICSDAFRLGTLTDQEAATLELLAAGLNNDQIAMHQNVTKHTVRTHSQHVLHKLGVGSQAQAVVVLWRYRYDLLKESI